MSPNNIISLAAYRENLKQIPESDLCTAIQALIQSLRLNTPYLRPSIQTLPKLK